LAPGAQAELMDIPQVLLRRRRNNEFERGGHSGVGFNGFEQLVEAFP
jgi:hypothetical protein